MKSEKVKIKNFQWRRHLRVFLYFSLLTFNFSLITAFAQDEQGEIAPPPLKIISKDERTLLAAKLDIKDRTKLSLELMSLHLGAAEKQNSSQDFDGMFRDLGAFQALMDDSLDFLRKRDTGSGKVLDNFKRLELGLRGFSPRIETIRRELPQRYDVYVRKLMGYVREARTQATEPLFDDTVLPVRKPG